MAYRNEALHAAAEAYVRAALDLIAKKALTKAASTELGERDYFFARVESPGDLAKLPEYQPCLEALVRDPHIATYTEFREPPSSSLRSFRLPPEKESPVTLHAWK